jgi:hypothetical protein
VGHSTGRRRNAISQERVRASRIGAKPTALGRNVAEPMPMTPGEFGEFIQGVLVQ